MLFLLESELIEQFLLIVVRTVFVQFTVGGSERIRKLDLDFTSGRRNVGKLSVMGPGERPLCHRSVIADELRVDGGLEVGETIVPRRIRSFSPSGPSASPSVIGETLTNDSETASDIFAYSRSFQTFAYSLPTRSGSWAGSAMGFPGQQADQPVL